MNGSKIAYINNIRMYAHNIALYDEEMEVFHLNVLTNDHFEERQTLLLLHGYLGSVKDYYRFFEKFNQEYNMIAIDLRGHGGSESPKTHWTIDDMVNDVYQVIRLLVPEHRKIIIVGNSLSTAITLKFASEYPEIVEKIFLISPTTKFTLSLTKKLTARFLNIIPNRIISSSLKSVERYGPKLIKSQGTKDFAKMAMEKINHVPVFVHKNILRVAIPTYSVDASDLTIPMLIVAGENDNTVPFTDSVHLNSSANDSTILILNNTKHMILVKRTDLVIDILDQWLHTEPDLLTDVKHYHETDLITNQDGHQALPEDWIISACSKDHVHHDSCNYQKLSN